MRQFHCLVFVAMTILMAGTAPANLITNGSFESVTDSNIDNWTLTPGASSGAVTDYTSATGTSPYGPHFLAFNAGLNITGGSATQDIAALDATTMYELTFAYGAIGTSGSQMLQLTINMSSVPLPAQTYMVTTPSNDFGTVWQRAVYDFQGTVSAVPGGVTFADLGADLTGDSDLIVDDVALVAIPEPTSAGLAGVAAVGWLLRRRRQPMLLAAIAKR
jgi:hypothetical protein